MLKLYNWKNLQSEDEQTKGQSGTLEQTKENSIMAYDYETMEKTLLEWLSNTDNFEEEEVLEDIKKLKAMSEEEIGKLATEMDNFIMKTIYDVIDEESGPDREEAWECFFTAHPDYERDQDKYEDEFDEYLDDKVNGLSGKDRSDALYTTFENTGDDESDEMRRNATGDTAEKFGFTPLAVVYLCQNALTP